jgi:hypothetical protein
VRRPAVLNSTQREGLCRERAGVLTTKSRRTGPAQSPSQRSLGAHTCGPASPSPNSSRLLHEAGSPIQDRMDDECALRYACSLAVKRGVYQVRQRPNLQRIDLHAFAVFVSHPRRSNTQVVDFCCGSVQLDWIDKRQPGARQREDLCSYTEGGILKPQRLVSRYSCLTRNNACLDLSTLDEQA